MSDKDHDLDRVQKAIDTLSEHFDTVQVFTTRHESGTERGTINVALGTGNWFARYGQVQEWLIREDESARIGRRDKEP